MMEILICGYNRYKGDEKMIKHICECGYIYNPKYGDITSGVSKGITFDQLPEEWKCPYCGAGKDDFREENKKKRAKFISFR